MTCTSLAQRTKLVFSCHEPCSVDTLPWGACTAVLAGEDALTHPKIPADKYLALDKPFVGPRKLLLVCLFTGGEPSKLTPTDQVERVNAVESTWADTDVVSPINIHTAYPHCHAARPFVF